MHFVLQRELAFDEQAGGAAAGIVDVHSGLGVHEARDEEADFGGSVEFARALAAAFGEFADEVFVAAADDVGLDIGQTEALFADALDQIAETVVGEIADAVSGGVEVDAIDDAVEQRIFVGDGPQARGKLLADAIGEPADDGPEGLIGVGGFKREIVADEFLIALDEPEGFGTGMNSPARQCGLARHRKHRTGAWRK